MKDILKSVDLYGTTPTMTVFGDKRHTTVLGGIASLITVVVSIVAVCLFGQDFFYKSNPRIVSQESISEQPKIIYPTSSTFTIFFEVTNSSGERFDIEKTKTKFFFSFKHAKKNEEKVFETLLSKKLKPIKCSETPATENPTLANYNLSEYYCLNWEELIEEFGGPVPFGGFSDDDQYSLFRVKVTNNTFDSNSIKDGPEKRSSFGEVSEEISKESPIIKIYYPSFLFEVDSYDKPFKTRYDVFIYNLTTEIRRIDRHFFEAAFLEDDKGWIFKDVKHVEGIRHDMYQAEVRLLDREADYKGRVTIYTLLGYLNKKNTIFRRNYMKIQELAALAGGFIKIISLFSEGFVSPFASFDLEKKIMARFKGVSSAASTAGVEIRHSFANKSTVNRSNIGLAKKEDKTAEIGFWRYLMLKFKIKGKKANIQQYLTARLNVFGKIDYCFLINFFSCFEKYLAEKRGNVERVATEGQFKKMFKVQLN